MIRFLTISFLLFAISACEDNSKLPVGFEHISKDGRSHFLLIQPEHIDNKVLQRKVARNICTIIFQEADYCEVYYFDRREDVPQKFPIVNRIKPLGHYELKSGKETFKALSRL